MILTDEDIYVQTHLTKFEKSLMYLWILPLLALFILFAAILFNNLEQPSREVTSVLLGIFILGLGILIAGRAYLASRVDKLRIEFRLNSKQ